MRFKILTITVLVFATGLFFLYGSLTSASTDTIGSSGRSLQVDAASVRTSTGKFQFAPLNWQTIVNNGFGMPGSPVTFSSYGQPSINTNGTAVFRARSTGGQRQTGIYTRHFPKGPVQAIADLNTLVPYPNNLDTTFQEFSSIPRISINADNVATRGVHQPVYSYLLPDGTETRVGTTGIYAMLNDVLLVNGASKLGTAPGFEDYAVPGLLPLKSFDVFPGSPAISDNDSIAFKGNYTVDGVGKTGIFYRSLLSTPGGGKTPVQVIASSDTNIPNIPPTFKPLPFGSTAPPSIAGNYVVFTGLDNEDNPNFGGIYRAELSPNAELQTLVGIGEVLPGLSLPELTRIGEGLSFDGRYVGFWGAWGRETKTIRLYCPEDGNPDLLAFCNGIDPRSAFDVKRGKWFQTQEVMVHQGIFVYDIYGQTTYMVANSDTDFNDFVFWGYSGKAPGSGSDEDSEPPRWRSASFLAVSDGMVVFKARTGYLNGNGVYLNPIDGLYMANGPGRTGIQVLAETGMDGALFDPGMPGVGNAVLPIIGLGIERDGFRGNKLAITATMANDVDSWGGIYVTNVPFGPAVNTVPSVDKLKSEKTKSQ